jgi:hypothetical protein
MDLGKDPGQNPLGADSFKTSRARGSLRATGTVWLGDYALAVLYSGGDRGLICRFERSFGGSRHAFHGQTVMRRDLRFLVQNISLRDRRQILA